MGKRRTDTLLASGAASIQEPGRRAGLGDLADLVQQARTNRDPFPHPRRGVVPLRIARDHHRPGRIDGRCCAQIVAEAGHVGGKFRAVAKQARIDRDKAMADVVPLRFLGVHRVGDQRRAREAGAEDVDHHRQPITLVAGVLGRTAERGQEPAFLARFQRVGAKLYIRLAYSGVCGSCPVTASTAFQNIPPSGTRFLPSTANSNGTSTNSVSH
jgi:hypothetical protein